MENIDKNKVLCKHCGEMIDADESFCPVCGAVNKRSFREDPDKEYCVFCGSELGLTEVFCKVCGTPTKRVLSSGLQDDKFSPDSSENAGDSEDVVQEGSGERHDNADSDGENPESTTQMDFLRKAAMKQQKDAEKEEKLQRLQREEARVLQEEREKLRMSATQAAKSSRDLRATRPSQAFGTGSRPVRGSRADLQATRSFNADPEFGSVKKAGRSESGHHAASENPEERARLQKKAEEAGVSVDEIRLFEKAKASFESENETYPEDYNVNDYAHFDYAESRYGSYNMGSLEREAMEYHNQQKNEEKNRKKRPESRRIVVDQGVIGAGKKKKTPVGIRILVFFIAIFAVVGLAGIIMYIMPMMKNVHPEEILLDESVEKVELTITPISVATATPTPSPEPTPSPTPTPAVEAIDPQSITPSPVPVEEPEPDWDEETDADSPESEFLVSDSTTRYMDPSELDGLSPEEIRLISNEIYARYGYTFRNRDYFNYFSQFDWYDPVIPPGEFPDDILSEEAQANLDMIAEYEAEHGY